mgnify:CR=1 FL=1
MKLGTVDFDFCRNTIGLELNPKNRARQLRWEKSKFIESVVVVVGFLFPEFFSLDIANHPTITLFLVRSIHKALNERASTNHQRP